MHKDLIKLLNLIKIKSRGLGHYSINPEDNKKRNLNSFPRS